MIKIIKIENYMEEIYNRISSNKPFDKKLRPYTISEIKRVLYYFEEKEEYEKCSKLLSYVNSFSK